MPRSIGLLVAVGLLFSIAQSAASAQATHPELIKRGAMSAVAVEFKAGPKPTDIHVTTAFCVDATGLFLTVPPHGFNEHDPNHGVRIVLGGRALPTKLVPVRCWGITMLSAPGANVPAIEIAQDAKWTSNMPVSVPLSNVAPNTHGAGPIRACNYTLVNVAGGPWKLQPIGGDTVPGTSVGAPVLDGEGKLTGMVTHGYVQHRDAVVRAMAAHMIEFDPPAIQYSRRTEKRDFTIRVHSYTFPRDKISVELGTGSIRRGLQAYLATNSAGESWKVSAPPLDSDKDTTQAPDYRIRVKIDDKLFAEYPGTFDIEGAPLIRTPRATTLPLAIAPPEFEGASLDVRPAASMGSFVVGGSGRLVVGSIPLLRRLVVLDVCAGSIVKYLSVGAHVHFAATGSKLIVVLPDQNQIQRWDLLTFEREQTAPIPRNLNIHSIVAGSAADSTALMVVSTRDPKPQFSYLLLDVMRLTDLPLPQTSGPAWPAPVAHTQIRASADGRCFTAWTPGGAGTAVACWTMDLAAKPATSATVQDVHLVPGADGSLLLGPTTAYGADLKALQRIVSGGFAPLPSSGYFLQVEPTKLTFYLASDRKPLISSEMQYVANPHYVPAAKLMVICHGHAFQLRRFDMSVELEKSGQDYFFIDSLPPRYARKGQKYVYQATAKSKGGAFRFSLDGGPKGMTINDAGLIEWTPPPFAATVPITIVATDAANRTVKQTFTVTIQ